MKEQWKVIEIPHAQTYEWLLRKHYAKRIPIIMYSYGIFVDGVAQGVITYGMPPNPNLLTGICGEKYASCVLELNRLCVNDGNDKNLSSFLVSHSLQMLPKPSIVVSYADTSMGHIGYIYQATNFLYTGISALTSYTKELGNDQHSRHIVDSTTRQKNPDHFIKVDRPRKHRYVYFVGSTIEVRQMKDALNYSIYPYPKGITHRYDSGKLVESQMALPISLPSSESRSGRHRNWHWLGLAS